MVYWVFLAWINTQASGLPEPGFVIYGMITTATNQVPILTGTLTWTNSVVGTPAAKAVTQATLVSVNGQPFYILRVPFETRTVGVSAPVVLTPTPNTLELIQGGATYQRSAFYVSTDGQQHSGAALVAPASSTYSFGAADRGKVERVDLTLAGVDAFSIWIAQFTNIPPNLRGPNDDPNGNGVSNYSEFLAGTDPSNPNSFLHLIPDINATVVAGNFTGIKIIWSSVSGKTYSVQRSTDLTRGFVSLGTAITATDVETTVADPSATGPGPYFYRILLDQ